MVPCEGIKQEIRKECNLGVSRETCYRPHCEKTSIFPTRVEKSTPKSIRVHI